MWGPHPTTWTHHSDSAFLHSISSFSFALFWWPRHDSCNKKLGSNNYSYSLVPYIKRDINQILVQFNRGSLLEYVQRQEIIKMKVYLCSAGIMQNIESPKQVIGIPTIKSGKNYFLIISLQLPHQLMYLSKMDKVNPFQWSAEWIDLEKKWIV